MVCMPAMAKKSPKHNMFSVWTTSFSPKCVFASPLANVGRVPMIGESVVIVEGKPAAAVKAVVTNLLTHNVEIQLATDDLHNFYGPDQREKLFTNHRS